MPDRSASPLDERPRAAQPLWLWLAAAAWIVCVVGGLSVLWAYENTPGAAAESPSRWPEHAGLERGAGRPTLILLAHPQCSCTRASLGELAELLARVKTAPKTYVLFLKPATVADGWETTDLWRTAARLPGVTVVRDDDGVKAKQFGAITSGQTVLYDAGGVLRFSGGITSARGHAGDNAGRAALVRLLNDGAAKRSATSVFGCPLFTASR